MTKVYVHGASGKMGQEIIKLLESHKDFRYLGAVDRQYDLNPEENAVVIDFSLPEAMESFLRWCGNSKIKVVSGTTGISPKHFDLLKSLSTSRPILWGSNMSIGIAVFKKMMESLHLVSEWDFQIEEFHHNKKKDSPSGTALTLQTKLNDCVGKSNPPILSARGGGIFGIHKVWAMGPSETLRIEHEALDRRVFAEGALAAAQWLSEKKSGYFEFSNIIEKI